MYVFIHSPEASAGRKPVRGFTLIELMVVATIITVLTSVILTSQSSFNKTLVLANTAYDVALTFRSAQTFGLSSRGSSASVNAGYGLHFQNGVRGTFLLFIDTQPPAACGTPDCKPGDHVYTSGSDVLTQTYSLGNGITVGDFCAFNGSWTCAYSHGSTLSSLDIVFVRPDQNPFMSVNGSYSATSPVTATCLAITSPQGGFRYVSVALSGQIVANATQCP